MQWIDCMLSMQETGHLIPSNALSPKDSQEQPLSMQHRLFLKLESKTKQKDYQIINYIVKCIIW